MKEIKIYLSGTGRFNKIPLTSLLVFVLLFSLISSPNVFAASWESIGPSGGSFGWSMTNPANANQITAITTYPSPTNVYRSNDGGVSWNKIGEIPYSVSDVCAFNFSKLYAVSGSRCYRSVDGGVTWTYTRFPPDTGTASHICVDPIERTNRIYAVGRLYNSTNGTYSMTFFKSVDSGRNWNAKTFFPSQYFYPIDMAISKSNPSIMYVTGYKLFNNNYYGFLFKSSDGGNNWTDISTSVSTIPSQDFFSVAIDPTDPDRIYVGAYYFSYNIGRPSYKIYRSERNGNELTWTSSNINQYAFSISIDPVEPSNIYAAGYKSISVSSNYGQTWTTHTNCFKGEGTHIEVAEANPSTVFLSSNNGLFKSSDSGNTWNFAHEGIHGIRASALAISPSYPEIIIIEYDGCEVMGSYNSGDDWNYLGYFVICGNVCDILINPVNHNVVLALEGDG